MVTIKYIFEDGSEAREVQIEPGYTVLEAALLNDIKLNHNCGGVCACSTCHVYIEKGMETLPETSKRKKILSTEQGTQD